MNEMNSYGRLARAAHICMHTPGLAYVRLVGPARAAHIACVRTLHVRFSELIVDLKPLLLLKTHGIFTDGIFRHVLHTHIEKQPYNHILKI